MWLAVLFCQVGHGSVKQVLSGGQDEGLRVDTLRCGNSMMEIFRSSEKRLGLGRNLGVIQDSS